LAKEGEFPCFKDNEAAKRIFFFSIICGIINIMYKIVTYGNPILEKVSCEVKSIKEIQINIPEFIETMYVKDGVGLAAPQVGINQRIIAVDPTRGQIKSELQILINPVITEKSDEMMTGKEGCLSFPGLDAEVLRHKKITVSALDAEGREQIIEAEGYKARILQHEIDHLDGILLVDRMSPLERKLLENPLKKLKKETLKELKQR
jgi:peptide deformylase